MLLDPLLVSGDNLLELVHVGPGKVSHLGLVLDEDEGGHSGDLVLGRNVLAIINVNLKNHFCVSKIGEVITITLRNTTLSSVLLISSRCGAIILQGPHQVAKKSTTTSLPPAASSWALKSARSLTE